MTDLGNLLGALMSGLVNARRISDEQSAILAEYYRENPLLEGLSVPRVRVPELTIDLPMLIEDHIDGEFGKMAAPNIIAGQAKKELQTTLNSFEIKVPAKVTQKFETELKKRLTQVNKTDTLILKESVVRQTLEVLDKEIRTNKIELSAAQKKQITTALRKKIEAVSLAKEPVASSIIGNIRTADVKEKSAANNVVRIKVTLREEGLEWASQSDDSGATLHSLQPE